MRWSMVARLSTKGTAPGDRLSGWMSSAADRLPKFPSSAMLRERLSQSMPSNDDRLHALEEAEGRMLRGVKTPLIHTLVPIPQNFLGGKNLGNLYINTVMTDRGPEDAHKPPLLLVHGWGGGLGIWVNNLDALAEKYRVYAIDLLGWGRSSRPAYSYGSTPSLAQSWWVESIEAWRKAVGIDRFILCGHSMGGFISASYALKYSHQLDRLILLSPIGLKGFTFPPATPQNYLQTLLLSSVWNMTPQRILSFMSPNRVKGMLTRSRAHIAAHFPYEDDTVVEYVYRLATMRPVSGEVAFTRLFTLRGWTLPLGADALRDLPIPLVLAYGDRDWINPRWAIQSLVQPSLDTYLTSGHPSSLRRHVYIAPKAGHHLYCESSVAVNRILLEGHAPPNPLRNPGYVEETGLVVDKGVFESRDRERRFDIA